MPGINSLLNIGWQALRAEQAGVEVTSHNISNVNTPGYSRQRVDLVTGNSIRFPWGVQGNGVEIASLRRFFDPFLALKLDEKTASLQYYEAQKTDLERIAELFNETQEGGLNDLMADFWQSWHDLADNPTGTAERQAVLQRAQMLSGAFTSRADSLMQQRMEIVNKIKAGIDQINSHTARIAELNGVIVAAEAAGHTANDWRDQRQVELTQLSELIGIHYFEVENGAVTVMLPGGTTLAQGHTAYTLSSAVDPATDKMVITWHGPNSSTQDITSTLSDGQLTAWINVRDDRLPAYLDSFNTLAKELIGEVNRQHSQGVGLSLYSHLTGTYAINNPGNPLMTDPDLPFGSEISPGSFKLYVDNGSGINIETLTINITASTTLTGLAAAINASPNLTATVTADNRLAIQGIGSNTFGFANDTSNVLMALGLNTFFSSASGDTQNFAFTMAVNDTVSQDVDKIATGQINSQGNHPVGENRNALALAALESAAVGPGGLTFAEAYQQLVSTIGLDTQNAEQQGQFLSSVVEQYTALRNELSGVNLDEELTALIKFQRGFQAAAKLISAADELYQALLNLK